MGVLKGPRRRRPLHVIAVKHATPRLQRAMRAMSLDDSRGRQWAYIDASLLRQYRCREAVSLQMAGGSREKRRAAADSHPRPHAACPTNTANALEMRARMRLTPYGAQATEPMQTAGCSCLSRQLLEYVSLLPWWRARAACAAATPSSYTCAAPTPSSPLPLGLHVHPRPLCPLQLPHGRRRWKRPMDSACSTIKAP
jgi:hypothetical protein